MQVAPCCCQVKSKSRSQFLGPLCLWQCLLWGLWSVLEQESVDLEALMPDAKLALESFWLQQGPRENIINHIQPVQKITSKLKNIFQTSLIQVGRHSSQTKMSKYPCIAEMNFSELCKYVLPRAYNLYMDNESLIIYLQITVEQMNIRFSGAEQRWTWVSLLQQPLRFFYSNKREFKS